MYLGWERKMKTLKIALLASVALVGVNTAVQAADLVVLDPMVEEFATGFDWDGAYFNLSAVGGFPIQAYGVTGAIGFGATSDSFYYGAELVGGVFGPALFGTLEGDVRLGVLVSDDFLLYGVAGVGAAFIGGGMLPYGVLGAGAEFAVTDTMTIRAQYQANISAGPFVQHVGKIGLSWYF